MLETAVRQRADREDAPKEYMRSRRIAILALLLSSCFHGETMADVTINRSLQGSMMSAALLRVQLNHSRKAFTALPPGILSSSHLHELHTSESPWFPPCHLSSDHGNF